MRDPGLTARVALVTGANHGIGAAISRELAGHGVRVVATYLRMSPTDLDSEQYPAAYGEARGAAADVVVTDVETRGGKAIAVEADLRDPEVPARLFDLAEKEFGPVEILVNNASAWKADTFVPQETDRFGRPHSAVSQRTHDFLFGVDARASAMLIAEFAERHTARAATWGRIVGIGSGGAGGFPGEVSYGAAKAAMQSYTLSAAQELWPYGVTANVVLPPAVDTGWISAETRAAIEAGGPGSRVASPEDIAEVVCLLASDQARFITGQVIPIR
ncbi:MAG: SDR family oxidoreductase [Catenulisporales bacterium]|nr:SDR family oxidoreductase [Catenulisporales bacterium]